MSDTSDLKAHFDTLGIPETAQAWLLDVWAVTQVMDDATDGDAADPEQVRRAVWAVFQNMPLNEFYRQYAGILHPVMVLQLLKWETANDVEARGEAGPKSYVWRAGFYDLVLMVCHLCGIERAGHACMEMYGETFDVYMGEQQCLVR